MKFHFESAMEKLARILARQYHIDVVFEGSQAKTDGKKIYLPQFRALTEELKQDLHGFLDHEVAHCKFTDFTPYQAIRNKLVQNLANAAEDIRIEKAMVGEFAGSQFNLGPLRDKVAEESLKQWKGAPALPRIVQNVQWAMEGRETRIDDDIKRYWDAIASEVATLNDCKSTREIIEKCEKIAKLLKEEREEEKEEQSEDESSEDSEKSEGKSGSGEGSKGDSEGDESEEGESDSESGDSEGEEESSSSEDASSTGEEGKGSKSKSKSKGKPSDASGEEMDEMLNEGVGDKKRGESKFDKLSSDLEDFINDAIKDHIKEEKKGKFTPGSDEGYSWDATGRSVSIPFTTRYDTVTDHSGKGSHERYSKLRREVKTAVAPIKAQLERVLKVKENARWRSEREEGKINPRALSRLGSDKSYRQIFRDYTKTETNNVAVEILVDMSGSMGGRMETAKLATVAMAEALKELDITFEVTGFHSKPHGGVSALASGLDRSRFTRPTEHLDLHVFKSFDVASLNGIEKLFVGQQNPDGECVKWAASRLALRKEKRKILLVLSDGMPATGDTNASVLQADLKLKVQQIEKSGIECIGVGINTDAPKHFYKDYIVVNNLSSLPREAMAKLAKIIGE
jgi:cobalamin biosynthesis protein CobT